MKLYHTPQGSEAWHRARAGVISGSRFAVARAKLKSGPSKGEPTSAAHDYAFRLAVERISGAPLDDDQFSPWQAARGTELEPQARRAHEARTGLMVDPVGFITTDCGKFGVSADGLIEEIQAGAEYKCFLSPEKLRAIILDDDLDDVIDQIQGGMWITGRKVWHLALYCPALACIGQELTVHVIERDDEYIAALERDLREFDRLVTSYEAKLRLRAKRLQPEEVAA